MTNKTSPTARLLFIMDKDFGALGLVMYFLFRQSLSTTSTLLLPRDLYDLQNGQLQVESLPYQSLEDILDVVETDPPDVVFLVSGYSFAYQRLLTIRDLQKLIHLLQRRGCKVATTDPYLGTFRQITESPERESAVQQHLKKRLTKLPGAYEFVNRFIQRYKKAKLKKYVSGVADSLSEVTHICPVPMDEVSAGCVRYASFFNKMHIRSHQDLQRISARVSAFPDVSSNKPRWLFVLARFDLEFQEKKYGRQGFVDIVVSKLRQTLDNGRHPTFIGPAALVQGISHHFTQDAGVSLLPICQYEEFQQRLLDAEIVFNWQFFSTSTFLRLWNGLPVFFFDQGHTARFFKPMHEAGLRYYYVAGSPILLDIEKPLDAARLAEHSIHFRQSADDGWKHLVNLPTPEEMVSNIMGTV